MERAVGLVDYDLSTDSEEEDVEVGYVEGGDLEEGGKEEDRDGDGDQEDGAVEERGEEDNDDEDNEEEDNEEENNEEENNEEEDNEEEDNEEEDNDEEDNEEEDNEEEDNEEEFDNSRNRRQIMRQVIKEGNLAHNFPTFQPDDEDLKWEKQVFRKEVLKRSGKIVANPDKVDPLVLEAIDTGGEWPKILDRQVPNTAKLYNQGLRQIAGFYQDERPNIVLHYRYFVAFGTDSFVRMSNPKQFLENWPEASLQGKKNFLASHARLLKIIRDAADSPRGQLDFALPYREMHTPEEAERRGSKDAAKYIAHLDKIKNGISQEHYWKQFAHQINNKRIDKQETKDILWNILEGTGSSGSLSQDIFKYLESTTAKEAEADIIMAANDLSQPLSDKKFIKNTRYLVTRIQIFHGTRQEAQNMTVKEWDSRKDVPGSPGLVVINRKFTKLEGKTDEPTILVLGLAETALCILYDMAKRVKFPELVAQPFYRKTSFFLNSAGNTYSDQHGNGLHLTDWNRITGREDTINSFRTLVSNYSLTQDEVTRANLAFANNHSPATMSRVYAQAGSKVLQGIHALLKYREEQLDQPATSNLQFTKIRLPKELMERQRENKIQEYEENISRVVEIEKTEKKGTAKKGPANPESRCALVELIAAEIKSGTSVNDMFLADFLLKKPRKFIGVPIKIEAILRVIDSFKFARQPHTISLQEFLIDEARQQGPKNSNDINDALVDSIEKVVVEKWLKQLKKMSNPGIALKGWRIPAAFLEISIATGSLDYCLGSDLIAQRIRNMVQKRGGLENGADKEEEEEEKDALSPTSIVRLSRKNMKTANTSEPSGSRDIKIESSSDEEVPQRGEKRKNTQYILHSSSDEEGAFFGIGSSPSIEENLQSRGEKRKYTDEEDPEIQMVLLEQAKMIKVQNVSGKSKRLKHWTKEERVNLLTGVLAWMNDPTLPYQSDGKKDLLSNVSPLVTENRPYESVQDQYYRVGSPDTPNNSMYIWLENYVRNSPQIEWNAESLRNHQKIIVDAYKAQYSRKS